MTSGVLPVPPTLMLPTTMTGAATRTCRRQPCAYSQYRLRTRNPNTGESLRNHQGG